MNNFKLNKNGDREVLSIKKQAIQDTRSVY